MLDVSGWERSQGELMTVLDLTSLVKQQLKHRKRSIIAPLHYTNGPGYRIKCNTSTGKPWGRSAKFFSSHIQEALEPKPQERKGSLLPLCL